MISEWLVPTVVVTCAAARIVRPSSLKGGRHADVAVNWLSRLQSVMLVATGVSLVIGTVAAYGATFIDYLLAESANDWERRAKEIGKYGGLLTWAVSVLHAARTGAPVGGGEARGRGSSSAASRLLLTIAPPLMLIVLLLAAAWAAQQAVQRADHETWIPVVRQVTLIGAIAMALYAFSERRDPATMAWAVWIPGGAVLVAACGALAGLSATAIFWISLGGLASIGAWRVADSAVPDAVRRRLPNTLRPRPMRFDRAVMLVVAGCALTLVVGSVRLASSIVHDDVRLLLGLCALLFTTLMLIGWTTDPNSLSLHTFYKMRLVRAYLGASNPERTAQDAEDVTETRAQDDVLLTNLAKDEGPYHLVNATLNLTTGSDLTVAQRSAAPFLFSREFCGSARTGFRRTSQYRAGSLTLGSAVAISGAAASPVMGSQTPSTALSMLLALLNVRLGYWVPTPGNSDWEAPQARLWPFYLLREFLSHLADTGSHCYVTDGGHFDNTGVYPLVERGCQTIVVTDCGADPDTVFDDLSNLVRLCRIDFGAEITFKSLEPFSRAKVADRGAFVEGEIRYRPQHLRALGWPDQLVDKGPIIGTLVVIKPTLWGTVETDVNRYSQRQADFPQQSTADQWFDEAQFESYRRLGEISGTAAADTIRSKVIAAPTR